ncbi:MAG: hypothetical protein EOO93_29400 [Pedobacter sp.]|nr:MAG: hypothetical protein EOO93_29400 [Pedobacter sp.]
MATNPQAFKYNYCTPTIPYLSSSGFFQEKNPTDLSFTTVSLNKHDQLLCHLLGISADLNELLLVKKDGPTINNSYLRLKQKIGSRIALAQSQLTAVAAELDCEGERSDMAADYLDGLNSKRNRQLTVGSVIVGALTTVAGAVTKNSTQTIIGISGGLVSAGLGAMTINPKGKKVEFYHEHNLLRAIWREGEKNSDYPDFVWKMLNEKEFSTNGNVTLIKSIKSRWLQFEFNGGVDVDEEKLLFGNGGFYRSEDLHTRSAMINQLQSTIRSIHQDFISLMSLVDSI